MGPTGVRVFGCGGDDFLHTAAAVGTESHEQGRSRMKQMQMLTGIMFKWI